MGGSADTFLFRDEDDYLVSDEALGTSDGVTDEYRLVRVYGGFVEPVLAPDDAWLYLDRGAALERNPASRFAFVRTGADALTLGVILSMFSVIGIVMLMGLVTKNAILLVDFANQRRKEGLAVAEALLEAGLVRMRPIMMTTAAMVFGMLPLALALNEGAELQSSMGRAIIGGVITSTLLTLVVVPVVYSFMVRGAKPLASAQPDESSGSGAGVPGGASVLTGQADD